MGDWANALAGALATGVGAAAQTGAGIIGDQMKQQQQIEAEQRAADTQLDLHERMAAADDMLKNRALERYASIVKTQAGTQVPQEADSVDKTGITREAGKEAGTIDVDGTKMSGDFKMSAADLQAHIQSAQQTLQDPNATDEQKADAKGLIAVLQSQVEAQKSLNEDAVDGKTRPRTTEEAVNAANDYALQNDPTAYVAGTKAYNDANKDDIAEKKLAQQLTLQRESGARAERLAQLRSDTMLAKLGGAGGGGKEQANIAQIEYLMTKRGLSQDQALNYVYGDNEGLHTDPAKLAVTLATQFLANGAVNVTKDDPPGTTKASKAMQMAMDQVKTLGALRTGGNGGGGMLDSLSPLPGMPAAPGATGQPDPKNPLGLNLAPRKGN